MKLEEAIDRANCSGNQCPRFLYPRGQVAGDGQTGLCSSDEASGYILQVRWKGPLNYLE